MGRKHPIAKLRVRLREAVHCLLGAYYHRKGRLDSARDHFLRALEYDDGSFRAHVHLGRLYLQQQQYHLASEELRRAREINPHRWAKQLFPGDALLCIAEHLPEQRLRQGLRARALTADEGLDFGTIDTDVPDDVDDLPYGDFFSRAEADRFSLLPPIAISDVEEIDWAKLGRLLSEDD